MLVPLDHVENKEFYKSLKINVVVHQEATVTILSSISRQVVSTSRTPWINLAVTSSEL